MLPRRHSIFSLLPTATSDHDDNEDDTEKQIQLPRPPKKQPNQGSEKVGQLQNKDQQISSVKNVKKTKLESPATNMMSTTKPVEETPLPSTELSSESEVEARWPREGGYGRGRGRGEEARGRRKMRGTRGRAKVVFIRQTLI